MIQHSQIKIDDLRFCTRAQIQEQEVSKRMKLKVYLKKVVKRIIIIQKAGNFFNINLKDNLDLSVFI